MIATSNPAVAARPARLRTPPRRRSALPWQIASAAVIWGTSIVVAALWVRGEGIQDLMSGGGNALTTLGRATGLAAANLMLYQVLLMARVPVFERGLGRDTITRWHRLTGFWSFWLMIAHIILVVVGYAATANVGWWPQTVDFVLNYPAMLLATAGTVALMAVVALSIRAARRRLRYESWHLLHLYAYLGVGLALPHQLWTGADFLTSPLATAYWWTLWALALIAVIVHRIIVPLVRSNRCGLRVEAVQQDGARGVTVHMTGRHLDRLGAVAGQFLVFRFLDGPGWTRGHPFSLSATPDGRRLTVTARIVGDGTLRMTRLRPGTRVLIEGPFGRMTGDARAGRKLLMIGAGAGVAPLVALLQEQPWRPGEALLLTRDHRPEDALRADALQDLVSRRGLGWYRLDGKRTEQGTPWLPVRYGSWSGADFLRKLAGPLNAYDVYLCGPGPWMDAVRADLDTAGVHPDRIHSESFSS